MQVFICPLCGKTLTTDVKTYACPNGHMFDRSKYGYVNLLLSQKSSSKRSGDDKAMVKARKDFLSKGYYEPLLQEILHLSSPFMKDAHVLLDAGCGEGYYTQGFAKTFPHLETFGIDLSKEALIEAGKLHFGLSAAVASIFHLPVADASCDFLLNIFAPCCPEEFSRVLVQGGKLLRVVPLEEHLWELKQAIYEKPYLNQLQDPHIENFELIEQKDIRYTLTLKGNDIQNLFLMTPYYYKTSRADQEKCSRLQVLSDLQIAFRILIYNKKYE